MAAAIDQCPSSIVVFEGTPDMVNEALLFSPTRQDSKKTLIFPVGAYANLSLIAPEVWDSMLLVPSEQLVTLPAEHRAVQHCVKIPPTEPLNSLQVVDELNDLGSTLADAVPPQITCMRKAKSDHCLFPMVEPLLDGFSVTLPDNRVQYFWLGSSALHGGIFLPLLCCCTPARYAPYSAARTGKPHRLSEDCRTCANQDWRKETTTAGGNINQPRIR